MKITNAEAYGSFGVLQELKEKGVLGFAVAKNMRKLADELVEYDARRNEAIQKYGAQMGDGRFSFTPENAEQFGMEMSEYDSIKFDFEPMRVSEEVFCSGSLTSDQMYALMWMVEES